MKHLSEEQIILHHYSEPEDGERIARHLEDCPDCRARYQALQQALALVDRSAIPHRGENYGSEVWRQVRPRLPKREQSSGPLSTLWGLAARSAAWRVPRWALVGGLGVLLLAAFFGGRLWPRSTPVSPRQIATSAHPVSREARERVLLREIGEHLERSQLALIELINSQTNGMVDISLERSLAEQLVVVNRLYRQTAARLGDSGTANLLEDLERRLVEIANSPARLSPAEFADFRRRLDTEEMLFRIKVVSSQMRARELESARAVPGTHS